MNEFDKIPNELESYKNLRYSPDDNSGFVDNILHEVKRRKTRRNNRNSALAVVTSFILLIVILRGNNINVDQPYSDYFDDEIVSLYDSMFESNSLDEYYEEATDQYISDSSDEYLTLFELEYPELPVEYLSQYDDDVISKALLKLEAELGYSDNANKLSNSES
jgi:hypothetical protein